MNSPNDPTRLPPPLDLSGWKNAPAVLMVVGGFLCVIGAGIDLKEFGYSWLLAFMFYLTIALGALFLVLIPSFDRCGLVRCHPPVL